MYKKAWCTLKNCCFGYLTYCFFDVLVAVAVAVAYYGDGSGNVLNTIGLDPLYTAPVKCFSGQFFSHANRLRRTVQILLQIAVLFAVQKLTARSRRSRVNERQISASFCPFKNLSRPV